MFSHGVDAWWMDAVEPENDALTGEETHIGPGDFYRLIYPLLVSKSVYEGQRAVTDQKRVCILTRSAFAGQQRYGVINWSGDIDRKSTRLNSSHVRISYAVFCLKK